MERDFRPEDGEKGLRITSTSLRRGGLENAASAGPPGERVKLLMLERELGCSSRAGTFQPARVKWQCQELQTPAEWAASHAHWSDDGATWVKHTKVASADAFSAWDFEGKTSPADPSPGDGVLIQIGALCWESREAKAITRRYCPGGGLQAVVLSEGRF